jgi:hypothetical protein
MLEKTASKPCGRVDRQESVLCEEVSVRRTNPSRVGTAPHLALLPQEGWTALRISIKILLQDRGNAVS